MHFIKSFKTLTVMAVLLLGLCLQSNIAQAKSIKVKDIDAKKTGLLIQNYASREKPTIVFIYTSWCSVCRQNFPILLDMAKEYKSQGLNVLALSMDNSESELKRYLKSYKDIPFIPYIVKQRYSGELTKALDMVGIKYSNSIPFTAVYDNKGKLIGQGNIAIASLNNVVASLVNTNSAYNKNQRK